MKTGKPTKILPSRESLNQLDKTGRTILDYAKRSPLTEKEPNPSVILSLARMGK